MSASSGDSRITVGPALVRHPSLDEAFDPAVRIAEYDASWVSQAEDELRRLRDALGEVAVRLEHIGSTAVPGLAAKPIIDLQVSVLSLEPRHDYVSRLEGAGYMFVPDPASPGRRFFAKPPRRPRSHHVHVCQAGSSDEFRHLAVRDLLREHESEAARYATLRRELIHRHGPDRLAYIAAKDEYIQDLEARATAWAMRRA